MGIGFGLPTVPHQAAAWALNLADRLVLAGIVSSAALGVYSLGANLAIPVMVAVMSLGQAMMPNWSRAGLGELADARLKSLVTGQVTAITLITAMVALMASPLVDLMAPASFAGAAEVVGWIALGYGFLGLYYIPAGCINLATGRNRLIWIGSTLGAAVNLALLFIIVPGGGIRAAAIASAVGYSVLLMCTAGYWLVVRGDSPIRMPWRSLVVPVVLIVGFWVGADLLLPLNGASGFIARLGGCFALVGLATAVGAFGPPGAAVTAARHRLARLGA
jgi:O-antigen/teichoic acid export membrane protein